MEPITTALIVGLATQKFAEGAAGKLVERLWDAIADRFKGRKKTEENLAAIAAAKGKAPEAIAAVTTVLAGELVEDPEFKTALEGLAQQIIQIQQQNQTQSTMTFTANDNAQMRAVGQVYGTANLGDQK